MPTVTPSSGELKPSRPSTVSTALRAQAQAVARAKIESESAALAGAGVGDQVGARDRQRDPERRQGAGSWLATSAAKKTPNSGLVESGLVRRRRFAPG